MFSFHSNNDILKQQLAEESTQDVTKELAVCKIQRLHSTQTSQRAEATYEAERATNSQVSVKTSFDYAFWLISSPRFEDREKGVILMQSLLQNDERNRDYLYFLAIGNYKLQVC